MSLDGHENAPGCGSGGVRKNEELGMGRFGNDDAAAASRRAPSFKPEQIKAFKGSGFELIALHGPNDLDRHGRSIGKAPGKGWRDCQPLDVAAAIDVMNEGRNVGVRLRACDLVIDVDPRNFPPGIDPLRQLQADFSIKLANYPTVVTGSGGLHIYMRKPDEMAVKEAIGLYPGVEFKSLGRQVVAPGSVHPNTGKPYLWDDLGPMIADGVPDAPEVLLGLIQRPERASSAEAGEVEAERLAEMLSGLNAEDYRDHDRWLELMMACHHATGGAAREEFIAWSTSDASYSDHADLIGRRWDSLQTDRKGFTVRTLYMHLHKAGRGDLIPRRSAQDDFAEGVDDFTMDRVNADTGGETDVIFVDRMNEKFCAVLENGDFSIYMTDVDDLYTPPRTMMTRLTRSAFRSYHENKLITLPDQKRRVSVADAWLAHPKRREYPGIVLDPDNRDTGKLNLWQGWAVEPMPGDWSLMRRDLIEQVLCAGNSDHAEFVVRWMAFMVQKPGVRPEVAIAFRGNEGTGKSTLGRALMRIAGRHGITVSSPKQLAGNFNAHLRSAVFVFADEALWPGNKEAEGTLKQLVTEPVIAFEPKGKDVIQGRNLVHLMLASNEEWIVPAGKDARRFAVFDVTEGRRGDTAFWERLNSQMENGGYAAMLHDLLSMDLGDWHPARNVPQTQALADQKLLSLDPVMKFWMEVLERGSVGLIDEAEWLAGPITLKDERDRLREEYDAFLKRNRVYSAKATSKALAAAGKSFGLEAVKLDRNMGRGWIIPPLSDARSMFEARIGADGLFG